MTLDEMYSLSHTAATNRRLYTGTTQDTQNVIITSIIYKPR